MPTGPLIGQGRTAEMYAWGDGQVLKLFRFRCPRPWVEREARATRTAHEAGVPSPAVGGIVEEEGRPGIIFERVEGPSMLETLAAKPWQIAGLAHLLADLHAAMHSLEGAGLPSQHRRLADKIQRAGPLKPWQKDAALKALEELPEGKVICHGDFHPDNVILSRGGPIVIDWPDATAGHPLSDVARTLLLLEVSSPAPGRASGLALAGRGLFRRFYLQRYRSHRPAPADELAAWRLPVAAARLSEHIEEEEERLLAIVQEGISR